MSVGRRLSSSLGCFDDAETAELFSQDSGSTVSATPPRQESPCDRESELYISTSEEEVRRAVQHSPTALPVLQCAPDWLPQRAAEEEEEETRSADNATSATTWAADHVDYLTLFVRWRVSPPLQRHQQQLDNSREWTSTWMPYAAPLSEVFAAAFATKIAAVLHTPNTATTHSSGLDSALSIATNTTIAATHARQAHLTGSAQLPLGRAAFIDYVSVLGGMQEKSSGAERETLGEAAASVSRVHCSVHLHFTADRLKAPCQNEINNIDGNLATVTSPRCHSFDVFAVSPSTTLNGVPLHTHYRYHFRADDVSCCPAGVLSLKLGPRCAVDIALKGLPLFDASELAREHASGSLALHRPPQRLAPQQLRRQSTLAVASTTTTAAAAAAAIATTTTTTTSLFASDSTAVLATLSETSEPVALSDTAADDADDVVVESHSSPELLEEVQDDVMPKLTKRQHSTKTATPSRAAKAARPPRHSAEQRKEKTEIEGGEEEREPAAPAPDGKVIFTTGLRLSDSEEDALKALGAIVNPPLRFACYARLLVAQKPLMRSVKLLTVLPYVEEVVHQSWLDTAMHTHSLDIPTESFLYSERRLPGSIESVNNFELRETLRKLPQDRQRLLMGQRFWVHKATAPQDPPMNDLKTVLTASGGVVTRGIHAANVLVMPQQRPTLKCWRSLLDEMGCGFQVLAQQRQHGLLLVVPDDIFKCVLQQRPLVHSTVHVPRAEPTGLRCRSAKGSSGRASENSSSNKSNCGAKSKGNGVAPKSGRRSSQGSRKTPRPAASQRSPRPSTRRRSS
ncbi:hypothetical protein N2W54_007147 [Lotmaria passim]